MSEWDTAALADLMTLDVDAVPVDPAREYGIVGVLNRGRGLLYREAITGSETSYKALNRISPNQVVYSRLKAFEGAITVAPDGLHEVYASQEFPTFTCGQSLLPAYFGLLTTTGRLWDTLQNLSTGMGGRRERVKTGDFLTIRIEVPSLPEQRRIVDVMAAVDAHIEALTEEIAAADRAQRRTVSNLLAQMPGTRVLGEFTTTRSGPSFAASEASATSSSGAVPIIGIPNTKPDGSIDLRDIGYVAGLPDKVAKIDGSSLILIRTNGNRHRIGNVYLPPASTHGYVVSAFQFLMKVADPADREYVYWALREPGIQASMSEAASGTTGLGNLAVKWLNATSIPWSDDAQQRADMVRVLRGQGDALKVLRGEVAHLQAFRSALLTALLNQEIEIPEAYDTVLAEAVA